jgi:hypothetical protein
MKSDIELLSVLYNIFKDLIQKHRYRLILLDTICYQLFCSVISYQATLKYVTPDALNDPNVASYLAGGDDITVKSVLSGTYNSNPL